MKCGSLFAGIGGFDEGLRRSGMDTAWQVEIDGNCAGVLARHFDANIFHDIAEVTGEDLAAVELICGGFPCQDLSVAGKRAGLAGKRSGLWHEFHRVIAEVAPRWVLIENVPGLLSSNEGTDFGVVLGGLAELGYGWAYRVLDAQYFGVAQRRRRVFIVGCLGDRVAPAKVLFEPESCDRDSAPRRTTGPNLAGTLGGGPDGAGRRTEDDANYVMATLNSGGNSGGFRTEPGEHLVAHSLLSHGGNDKMTYVASFDERNVTSPGNRSEVKFGKPAQTLHSSPLSIIGPAVRRLTPMECERLQGFPDGWTDGQPDSTRYRQLGNAVCVNVAEWIGRRIMEVAA